MKKIIFFYFFLFCFAACAEITNPPISEIKTADVVEPSQQKQNFKILRNILGTYAAFRKVAWATLHDLNMVSTIAWTVQNTLNSFESFSNNLDQIYKNIQNLSNAQDVVNLIKDLETKVFEKTDPIILGNLPQLDYTVDINKKLRDKFLKEGFSTWKELKAFRDDINNRYFNAKFISSMRQSSGTFQTADPSNPLIKSQAFQLSIAAQAISSQDEVNRSISDQAEMISETARRSKSNEADATISQNAIEDRISQRNAYVIGLQYHDELNKNMVQENMFLLSKTKQLDRKVTEMTIVKSSADMFLSIAKSMKLESK